MNHIITVEKRNDDFLAYINGDRRLWNKGKTFTEAIGNAVLTHGRVMGIQIDALACDKWEAKREEQGNGQ